MPKKLPTYVRCYRDNRGKIRVYFRKKGQPQIPLPTPIYGDEFNAAYARALNATTSTAAPTVSKAGTMGEVIDAFYETGPFLQSALDTQKQYRRRMERIRTTLTKSGRPYGDGPVAEIDVLAIDAMIAREIQERGSASAKKLREDLNKLMTVAIKHKLRSDNPVTSADKVKHKPKNHELWTADDVIRFRESWAVGTKERLLFELAFFTSLRRGDLHKLGRQHVRGDVIVVPHTEKTGAEVLIPIDPVLRPFLDAASDRLVFCLTSHGRPWSSKVNLGQMLIKAARKAGLPKGRSCHGLRHSALTRFAELGFTPHQIMVISGHKNLQEVTTYTHRADRIKLTNQSLAILNAAA